MAQAPADSVRTDDNPENAQEGTFSQDMLASVVVFLVALPLCLGIALASGAPLFSGLLAGIRAQGAEVQVNGISVSADRATQVDKVRDILMETQRRDLTNLKALLNHAVKSKAIPSHQLTHYRVKGTLSEGEGEAKGDGEAKEKKRDKESKHTRKSSLKAVLDQLEVGSVEKALEAISQLQKVVYSVPPIENFIDSLCQKRRQKQEDLSTAQVSVTVINGSLLHHPSYTNGSLPHHPSYERLKVVVTASWPGVWC